MGRESNRVGRYSIGYWFLHGFGAMIARLYRFLFGRLDERLYQRNRRQLIVEIEKAFSGAMAVHCGSLVPGEGEELPRAFDYVAVTIEFTDIRVRLIRGQGELVAQLANGRNPHGWRTMSDLWRAGMSHECGPPPTVYDDLDEIANRLEKCWERLVLALA
jgi:hypothetical protein